MPNHTVAIAGLFCLDIIPEVTQQDLFPGSLIQVKKCTLSPGGPVSNCGMALYKMGLKNIYAFASVGKDAFANILLSQISPYLITNKIKKIDCSTAYTLAITRPKIDRVYLHCSSASDHFSSKNIDLKNIPSLDWFHFGYPPLMKKTTQNHGRELKKIFSIIKNKNNKTITSLDMSTPNFKINWEKFFKQVLPMVDVFCPSLEEVMMMLMEEHYQDLKRKHGDQLIYHVPMSIVESLADEFIKHGCRAVIIKMGARGLYAKVNCQILNWEKKDSKHTAIDVKVINTIGAGDVCIAGLIFAALKGFNLDQSLFFASRIASYSVRSTNAFNLVPPASKICL